MYKSMINISPFEVHILIYLTTIYQLLINQNANFFLFEMYPLGVM